MERKCWCKGIARFMHVYDSFKQIIVKSIRQNEFPKLWDYLTQFVTPERKKRFEEVVGQRTRFITIVLENIFQPHNASAVLRSAECFGVQDIHIIENENKYNINPEIVLGAHQWLTIKRWNQQQNNTNQCLDYLKKKGYTIAATTIENNSISLKDFFPETKTALVFGNEQNGISEIVQAKADVFVKIPMVGFTDSLNISVSAAIFCYHLTQWLKISNVKWQLKQREKNDLLLQWISNQLNNPDLLIEQFFKTR